MNGSPRLIASIFSCFSCAPLFGVLVVGACSGKAPPSSASAGTSGHAGAPATTGAGGGAGLTPTAGSGGAGSGVAGAGQAGDGAAGVSGIPDASEPDAAGVGGALGTGCKGATVCYDFEACATPTGWTVPKFSGGEGNQGAGTLLVDNEKAHDGTCSLHMKDFSGDQPQHAFIADLPANFGSVLWGSAWVYNTLAPTQHGALIKTRYAIPNSNDVDWYEVGYENKNYNGQWHNPLPPSGLPEWILRSTTPLAINTWQCVEWKFDAGNAAGAEAADPRLWIDQQEVTFLPGVEYDLSNQTGLPRPKTPKGNNFVSIEVGLTMYHQLDGKMNVYLDNLAFGKERVGCGP